MGKGYFSAKEALLLNGNFVISYLKSYDRRAGSGSSLGETLFTASLQEEVSAQKSQSLCLCHGQWWKCLDEIVGARKELGASCESAC